MAERHITGGHVERGKCVCALEKQSYFQLSRVSYVSLSYIYIGLFYDKETYVIGLFVIYIYDPRKTEILPTLEGTDAVIGLLVIHVYVGLFYDKEIYVTGLFVIYIYDTSKNRDYFQLSRAQTLS